MTKIAFLSDFHLTDEKFDKGLSNIKQFFKAMLNETNNESLEISEEEVNAFCEINANADLVRNKLKDFEELGVEHLALCGDYLGNIENPENILTLNYLAEILKQSKYWDPERLSLVPGNHDLCFAGNFPHWLTKIPNIISAIKGVPVCSIPVAYEVLRTVDFVPLQYFCNVLGMGCVVGAIRKENVFPFVKIYKNLAVLGIETTTGFLTTQGLSGGLTSDQLIDIEALLGSNVVAGKTVIVIMHHPPDKENFTDSYTELISLLEKHKVKLIVCGHTHKESTCNIGSIPILNVSGTFHGTRKSLIVTEDKGDLTISWVGSAKEEKANKSMSRLEQSQQKMAKSLNNLSIKPSDYDSTLDQFRRP